MGKTVNFKVINNSGRKVTFGIKNKEFTIDANKAHPTVAETGDTLKYKPHNASYFKDYETINGHDISFTE